MTLNLILQIRTLFFLLLSKKYSVKNILYYETKSLNIEKIITD